MIGAGLSGLAIARRLHAADADYAVFDKGRSPGGRAATRRYLGTRFDHGLPWLSEDGRQTAELIAQGRGAGLLEPLSLESGETVWFCPDGISALGKRLAADLRVTCEARATALRGEDGRAVVSFEGNHGDRFEVAILRRLFLTMPLPQVWELSGSVIDLPRPAAAEAIYSCCVVGLARLPAAPRTGIASPLFTPGTGPIESIVHEGAKFPGEPGAISARLTPEKSAELWDASDESIARLLSEELARLVEAPAPGEIQIKRWRYARASHELSEPCFRGRIGAVELAVCGDAFCHGKAEDVEAALMSAEHAYRSMLA